MSCVGELRSRIRLHKNTEALGPRSCKEPKVANGLLLRAASLCNRQAQPRVHVPSGVDHNVPLLRGAFDVCRSLGHNNAIRTQDLFRASDRSQAVILTLCFLGIPLLMQVS